MITESAWLGLLARPDESTRHGYAYSQYAQDAISGNKTHQYNQADVNHFIGLGVNPEQVNAEALSRVGVPFSYVGGEQSYDMRIVLAWDVKGLSYARAKVHMFPCRGGGLFVELACNLGSALLTFAEAHTNWPEATREPWVTAGYTRPNGDHEVLGTIWYGLGADAEAPVYPELPSTLSEDEVGAGTIEWDSVTIRRNAQFFFWTHIRSGAWSVAFGGEAVAFSDFYDPSWTRFGGLRGLSTPWLLAELPEGHHWSEDAGCANF